MTETTVTGKYCIIMFVVLPLGTGAMAFACASTGRSIWWVIPLAAWFGFIVVLLGKLRCPRCGKRVYSPFGLDPLNAAFYKSYKWGFYPFRCAKCGYFFGPGEA